MTAVRSPAYDFAGFGWLQFERMCSLILALAAGDELDWSGRADSGRVALVDGHVKDARARAVLDGPVTAVVVWVRPGARDIGESGALAAAVGDLPDRLGCVFQERVLVLTNLDGARATRALSGVAALHGRNVLVWGAAELSEWLDRHMTIRQALPAVLGSRDLGGLILPEVTAASSLDRDRAAGLARVFWPTGPYNRARQVLAHHRFVVLTGPPEMGKTAIAQMLGLVQMTAGWEAHECSSPDQLFRAFDRHRRQLFIADDAFGSTEYRPDAAERWAVALGRLLAMLDDGHWLIWTSRPAPLKAGLRRVQRERGSERFPAPGEVLVDAGSLDLAEKTLILFRHAKARGASLEARLALRPAALSIVEHPHFTPERIRRFVNDRIETLPQLVLDGGEPAMRAAVQRELAVPTEAMRTSFRALSDEHRELLIALLDAPAGLIDQRTLIATARRHGRAGLSQSPDVSIDRLTDHFLRIMPLGIGWVHPSWRDLVIDELREHESARQRFLSAAGVDGAILALSRAGGLGDRERPLLRTDADWDLLGGTIRRLAADGSDSELARLLLGLEDALVNSPPGPQRAECAALAAMALEAVAARWNAERQPVARVLIDAWYGLNRNAPTPGDPPALTWTWAELHPSSPGDAALDRSELVRADDWLGVVQTLGRYDPAALRDLGFFDRDQVFLTGLVAALQRTTDTDLRELVVSILTRVQEVAPRHFEIAELALVQLEESSRRATQWWVPEDLAAPPTAERVAREPVDFARADVSRVFADL
jgi:hypothetical protein